MLGGGEDAQAGLLIDVEEVFTHCSKAFLRAQLWDPERYVDRSALPSSGAILASLNGSVDPESYDADVPSGMPAARASTSRRRRSEP